MQHILGRRGLLLAILVPLALPLFIIAFSQQFVLHAQSSKCHGMTSASPVPAGYGAPYNTLSSSKELMLRVICDSSTSPHFEIGTGLASQYVYHIGYHYSSDGWQQLRLAGPKKVTSIWYEGSADVYIPPSFPSGETQYVVGYICTRVNNAWKCGCRDSACTQPYWQVQTFALQSGGLDGPISFPDPLALLQNTDELMIAYPSAPVASPGTEISLFGAGFSLTSNTVRFGTKALTNVPATSKNVLKVTVPNAPYGVTEVTVENSKGTSNGTFFVVKNPNTAAPTITSVSPDAGLYGTEVTIHGTGFAAKNTITGMRDPFEATSADGTTIKLNITPFPEVPELQTGDYNNQEITMPIYLRVSNENGIVADPKPFLLKI